MWTFQQTSQYVCFTAVRCSRTADDTAYRNWHVSMLAYFYFSLYFIDINHFNHLRLSHKLHIFSPSRYWNKLKNGIENKSIYRSAQSETAQYAIYFLSYQTHIHIRYTTLLPPFFSEIRGFLVKNWLYIYDPSLATTFSHLSGSVRIPRRKNWSSFEAIHESIQFFTSS